MRILLPSPTLSDLVGTILIVHILMTGMDLSSVAGAGAGAAALAGDPWLAAIGSVLGIGSDLLGYAHADIASKVAYERQNDFYDNHISMPAKVQEYEDAGLNPMALGF